MERGSGPTQLFRLQHFYDYARNTTRVIEDGDPDLDLTYVLDDLDRLLKRKITGGADQETIAYASSGGNDGRIGNITSKNGATYTYGAKPHAVTNDGSQACVYDDNGNMTRRGGLYLKYNPENQMVKASTDSAGQAYVARFGVDGDGRRVKRVDNYGTIHYVGPHYERNVGTGADTTETVTRFYVAQMGKMKRLLALRRKINGTYEDLRYVVPDHLGGTLRTVDTSGDTVDDIRYHAFGGTRSGGTNLGTDKRFTGQTPDISTGLYWYGSRAYDPLLGRFVQADSIVPDYKNPQALNRYSYVLNNPVKYTDPTGNSPWDPDEEGGGTGDEGGGDGEVGPEQWYGFAEPNSPGDLEGYYIDGATPADANVILNIGYAEGRRERGEAIMLAPTTPIEGGAGISIADFLDFANRVRPYGEWDYNHTRGPQYEDFGNFNFGAIGKAWGYDEETLLVGAGFVQNVTQIGRAVGTTVLDVVKEGKLGFEVHWAGGPYGDFPEDTIMIQQGFTFFDALKASGR